MIRKFQPDDIDTIMNIWLEANTKAHDFINKSYWMENYEMVKNMLPDASIFVFKENNTILGFIGLMDSYIAGIFIDVDYQSRGVGKALLDYVKERYSKLSLQVYKNNVRAYKFYLREGFQVTNEQRDEKTGEVELVMSWEK